MEFLLEVDFGVFFRQLFLAIAVEKAKRISTYLQDFCSLKMKLVSLLCGFVLKMISSPYCTVSEP